MVKLQEEFKEELEKGVVNIDDFVKQAEELKRNFRLDVDFVRKKLQKVFEEIDLSELEALVPEDVNPLVLIVDLPPLLIRAGCRAKMPGVVALGEALGYMYGGFLKYATCALLASTALSAGKDEVARELWRRCFDEDLALRLGNTCAIAEFVETNRLDIFYGLSRDVERLRHAG